MPTWTFLGGHFFMSPLCAKKGGVWVPFTYGGNTQGDGGRQETIQAYFDAEVKPYVPGAWVDEKKTKIGYEIPFTRFFYRYQPPRPLEEIDAELHQVTQEILALLNEVTE
ncbi:hypothetical protein [Actinomyces urogenitalis]|uniref:hypothetical protein n=1 Tax=Actinomyces urogenitalis TaxID=103621 RepID=UPI0024328B32|nr:hypothetical protein [Actinomyces urogenitalis]MCI7455995.1 hypothetical protein [Actinomyces urogenitalis]